MLSRGCCRSSLFFSLYAAAVVDLGGPASKNISNSQSTDFPPETFKSFDDVGFPLSYGIINDRGILCDRRGSLRLRERKKKKKRKTRDRHSRDARRIKVLTACSHDRENDILFFVLSIGSLACLCSLFTTAPRVHMILDIESSLIWKEAILHRLFELVYLKLGFTAFFIGPI